MVIAQPPLSPAPDSSVIVMCGISWPTYKAIMAEVDDNRIWRIAYDQNILELRMPSLKHEGPKGLLESFVEAAADELEIELLKAGALRLEREDLTRAIEPDSCFYIQHEADFRSRDTITLPQDPPPDLAIESDYTSSSINKLDLYAAMGVPELWRFSKGILEIYHLQAGHYQMADTSLAFPDLPVASIPNLIEASKTQGQRTIVRQFRQLFRTALETC